MNRRNDYKTALLIDAVIHDSARPTNPARELAGLGVSMEVAMRVLTRPAERRLQVAPPDDVRRLSLD